MALPGILGTKRRPSLETPTLVAGCLLVLAVAGVFSGLFSSRLPIAGDQASQNWWLLEFRDRLFGVGSHTPLSVFSWTNSSLAGMPFGFFYFPFPALVVSALSIVLPDALAVKVMLAAAFVLPAIGATRFMQALSTSRSVRCAAPAAATLTALVSVPYALGGNVVSTSTGEYSFAFALGTGLLALAELLRLAAATADPSAPNTSSPNTTSPKTSSNWWRAALLVAVCVLSHLQVAMMILVWAIIMLAAKTRSASTLWRCTTAIAAGVLLSAWWWLPAAALSKEALGNLRPAEHNIAGVAIHHTALVLVSAGLIGALIALRRHRSEAALLIAFAVAALLFVRVTPGSMWGARAFPMFWASLGLLVTYLVAFAVSYAQARLRFPTSSALALGVAFTTLLATDALIPNSNAAIKQISGFAQVQRGTATLAGDTPLRDLIKGLNTLKPGRALLAFDQGVSDAYGTDDLSGTIVRATKDRIQVLTGLFSEASITSSAAFSATNMVSAIPRSLSPLEPALDLGSIGRAPRVMEALAVRYVITADRSSIAALSNNPAFREVLKTTASLDPELPLQWYVFELTDLTYAGVVQSLTAEPFLSPVGEKIQDIQGSDSFAGKTREWIKALVEAQSEVTPAAVSGPDSWKTPSLVKPSRVSRVKVSNDRIEFAVDRTGVPVQIKVTWSSMWRASNAEGPYRVTPGFMVVVPTATHVVLTRKTPPAVPLGTLVSSISFLTLLAGSLRRRKYISTPAN